MMFFPAQVFAHVKHTKKMSEKLFFAKKQFFEQFFEQKNMSKKMSNHPFGFASENQATIHSVLYTTVFCEKIRTYQIMYPARTPTCPQLSQLFQ